MGYCHELLVNGNIVPWMFYEWSVNDNYYTIKDILVLKVSNDDMNTILDNHIKIDVKYVKKNKWIMFLNSYDTVVIKFSLKGNEIMRSRLNLETEQDVIECFSSLKEQKIDFELLNSIIFNNEARVFIEDIKIIKSELDNIVNLNNVDEAKYLYYEWFGKIENDLAKMVKRMDESLIDKNYSSIHRIGNLVKMFSK